MVQNRIVMLRNLIAPAMTLLILQANCNRDVRLAGQKIPNFKVGPVSHYGQNLDQNASPELVAFVALRAIREDFEAPDATSRDKALAVQFDLAAADEIQTKNKGNSERNEFIYRTVRRWTPTVAHYVKNFETDWALAQPRLIRRESAAAASLPAGVEECEVVMQVDDPSGDPNARALLIVWMAKNGGYWRVVHLGFDPTRRSLEGRAAAAEKAPPVTASTKPE